MSLYNMLFGVNKAAPVLIRILGIDPAEIPRFRDCYIDGKCIVIHTRTGGGNREGYEEGNNYLQKNKYYLHDSDDDFDSTYADFYFKFPEEYEKELVALSKNNPDIKPSEKWQILLKELKK